VLNDINILVGKKKFVVEADEKGDSDSLFIHT
jgi:hypothetical protein